eukprot:113831_1
MIGSIAGLIAGFSYVVTNQPIVFTIEQGWISTNTRLNLYGFLVTCSLLLSFGATLLATILYGMVNQIGNNKKLTLWFCHTFRSIFGIPTKLLILSVITVLYGSLVSIGGLYAQW